MTAHTCFSGPSKIWSVYSLPIRGRFDGRSPMYFSTAEKAKHASSASSSFVSSFLRSGCFIGSLEWRHSSSALPRRAEVSVRALDIVRFGGGLQGWKSSSQLRIHWYVSHLVPITTGGKLHSKPVTIVPNIFALTKTVATNMLIYIPQETLCILVCIPQPSFIKSSVIIITFLKGAQTICFGWGVGPSKWREGKILKFSKYNIHTRKCPQKRLIIVFKTPNCCQKPSELHYISITLAQCNNTLLNSLMQVNVTWRQNFSSDCHKENFYKFNLAKYPVIQQNVQT